MDDNIRTQLLEQFDALPYESQRRVLMFARALSRSAALPQGTPGDQLLRFAGAISKDDLRVMAEAIEEGSLTEPEPRGLSGQKFVQFAGLIPHEDLERMAAAIEEER